MQRVDPPNFNRPFEIREEESKIEMPHEDMASPIEQISQIPDSCLEEDVFTTLCREFKGLCHKLMLTIIPISDEKNINYLRNWDLWGPFIMAILFLLIMGTDEKFVNIVRALFFGATLVNFNIKALGGRISYFQALSILGYAMFPMLFVSFLLKVLTLFKFKYMFIIVIVEMLATFWSVMSARAFVIVNIKPEKKFVAIIPIFLVYFYVMSHFIFYVYFSDSAKEGADAAEVDAGDS